jgi:hypothetical protein
MNVITPSWFIPQYPENVGSETPLFTGRKLRPGNAVDNVGLVSVDNFANSSVSGALGLGQSISSTSDNDITSATVSFTLVRPAVVLLLASVTAKLNESVGNTADLQIKFNVDGSAVENLYRYSGGSELVTMGNHYLVTLSAGSHTFKLTANLANKSGSPTATIDHYRISYLVLGT